MALEPSVHVLRILCGATGAPAFWSVRTVFVFARLFAGRHPKLVLPERKCHLAEHVRDQGRPPGSRPPEGLLTFYDSSTREGGLVPLCQEGGGRRPAGGADTGLLAGQMRLSRATAHPHVRLSRATCCGPGPEGTHEDSVGARVGKHVVPAVLAARPRVRVSSGVTRRAAAPPWLRLESSLLFETHTLPQGLLRGSRCSAHGRGRCRRPPAPTRPSAANSLTDRISVFVRVSFFPSEGRLA